MAPDDKHFSKLWWIFKSEESSQTLISFYGCGQMEQQCSICSQPFACQKISCSYVSFFLYGITQVVLSSHVELFLLYWWCDIIMLACISVVFIGRVWSWTFGGQAGVQPWLGSWGEKWGIGEGITPVESTGRATLGDLGVPRRCSTLLNRWQFWTI